MKYKMLFSDMDGTLLKNDTDVSEKNEFAIKKAIEKGMDFVICTGRGVFGVEGVLEKMGLIGRNGHVICQNGGTVYNLQDMSLTFKEGFSPRTIASAVKNARKMDVELFYYDDRNFIAEKMTKRVQRYCSVMGTGMKIMEEPLHYDGEFTKCLLTGEPAYLQQLKREILATEGDKVDVFFSSEIFMEIVKKGVSKGNSMAATAKIAEIPLESVIAVGDSDNDLSMIRRAGLGVAVANAAAEIKAEADYVTQNTCEEDAVAEVIEKFVLN